MSRRRAAKKRPVLPDAKYNDPILGKFINCMMMQGKKSVAESILYDAFDFIEKKGGDAQQIFHEALANIKPSLEVRSRRIGGATYQVPIPVSPIRSQALGIRWMIDAMRKRSEKTMERRVAGEISDAERKTGSAVKKRETTHKMAEANKAFAHFRW